MPRQRRLFGRADVSAAIRHINDGVLRESPKANHVILLDDNRREIERLAKPYEKEAFSQLRSARRANLTSCEFCGTDVTTAGGRRRSATEGEPHSAEECRIAKENLRYQVNNGGLSSEECAEAATQLARLKDGTVGDSFVRDTYSAEELATIADAEGFAVEDLSKRWIVQHQKSFYFLTTHGFVGPVIQGELPLAVDQHLQRAPIVRMMTGASGAERRVSPLEQVRAHGTLAADVVADMTVPRSKLIFDETRKQWAFVEAACPVRELEPTFNPQIDQWLRIFGGAHAEKLFDWLATSGDLSRQTCALLLTGKKGTGKNMLAHGLSRRWSEGGPVALEDIAGNFNSSLTRSAIVFADEQVKLPDSKFLRSFIGSDARTLKRKFLSDATLRGCPRLIIAAQSPAVLSFDREIFEENDVDAIASRFLHIKAGVGAVDYLVSIGGREATEAWVNGDGIVKHVLHLAATRQVTPGSRFLVEGDAREMAANLATGGTVRSLVIEAVVRALVQLRQWPKTRRDGLVVGEGKIEINPSWLHSNWTSLVGEQHHSPTLKVIGSTLRGIATGEMHKVMVEGRIVDGKPQEKRMSMYQLRVELVLQAATQLGLGDDDELKVMIGTSKPASTRGES